MQPRRLNRAARKLCRKHAWNARRKQRHVPDAKQVLLWNDVQSRVGATATGAHVESPLRTRPFVDSCSARHQGNCCASPSAHKAQINVHATRLLRSHATGKLASLSVREETCSGKRNCCVLTPRAHLDLALCANRHVPSKRLLRSRAAPQDK